MVNAILTRLLRFAVAETRADRIYAFDSTGQLVDYAQLDSPSSEPPQITSLMAGLIADAIQKNELVLSNNTFIDPTQAPNTNTSIQNLRIYVVIPVKNFGVLFLDQPIRSGIVPRPIIDRLQSIGQRAGEISAPETLTDVQIRELAAPTA